MARRIECFRRRLRYCCELTGYRVRNENIKIPVKSIARLDLVVFRATRFTKRKAQTLYDIRRCFYYCEPKATYTLWYWQWIGLYRFD
jgi:hypothetical protein